MPNKDPKILMLLNLPFLIKKEVKSINKLHGGLTNHSYVARTEQGTFVCRFGPVNMPLLGLDKKREVWNTNQAAILGIGPQAVAYYPEHNLLINSFLPGTLISKDSGRTKKVIQGVARALSVLHTTKAFKGTYNFKKIAREQIAFLRKKHALSQDILDGYSVLNRLSVSKRKQVSCHVDLMRANMILSSSGIQFIDWEYSAKSDPIIDIAMASLELGWNAKDEAHFLKCYQTKESISLQDILLGKCIISFREALWGSVQDTIADNEIDYKDYVKKHLRIFNRTIKKVL